MSSRLPAPSYLAYRAGSGLTRLLPLRLAEVTAKGLGVAAASLPSGRRATLERHLRRVHGPDLRGPALAREVRRVFASYGRYWLETFRVPGLSPAELDANFFIDGLHHLQAARAAGRGVILAIPHLGGWEFGGAWFASKGFELTVVVEPVEPPELFEWFVRLRRSLGLTIVPLGQGVATQVLRCLRGGGLVALLCDRDLAGTGVEVEFFGERTTLPNGPATLALRTGAALLPTAAYFEGRRGHRALVRPPLDTARRGGLREDVARVTQELAGELEALIRRAPEQWHLLQPNWPSDPGYRH